MSIDVETNSRLKKWSEAKGLPLKGLQDKFNGYVADLKKLHPGKADSYYIARARFMVYRDVKSRGFIRAKPIDGIFFGYFPAWDITRSQRALAIETFRNNPEKALREGWTDNEGNPLDMRANIGPPGSGRKNPFYGKKLQPTYLARSVAATRPAEGGDIKMTVITHIGDQAMKMPPLGKSVRMLLNIRADEANRRIYNTSVATRYEPVKMEEFPKVDDAFICDYLLGAPPEFRTDLSNIHSWHTARERDIRRVAIVEGDVTYIRRAPTSTGNFMMVIEDESIMDLEAEGVTCFVPGAHKSMLNFDAGSRIVVLGTTGVGPGYNREARQVDTSVVRTIMNTCGIWCEPEFRIPLEEGQMLGTEVSENVSLKS